MLHQLVATICGITLQAQVNACRVTLQQATVDYNRNLDAHLNHYKALVVEPMTNTYTAAIFGLGKVVYDRRVEFNAGIFRISLRKESANCILQWTF